MLNSKEKIEAILLDDKSLEQISGGQLSEECPSCGKLKYPTLFRAGAVTGSVGVGIEMICFIAGLSCMSKSKKIKDEKKRKKYSDAAKRLLCTVGVFGIPSAGGLMTALVTGMIKAESGDRTLSMDI